MIETVCGPQSTVLTAPEMDSLSKAPNTLPLLTASGTFLSSNVLCPVTDFAVASVANPITPFEEADFVLTADGPTFTLAMTQ